MRLFSITPNVALFFLPFLTCNCLAYSALNCGVFLVIVEIARPIP